MSEDRSIRAVAALVATVAAVLYATRLAPSIVLEGDSTELVSAAAVWGVPHAPGFPLLTMLGHGMTLLPFGSIPWRVHLLSAFFHAGAVYVVALLGGRVTRSPLGAAVAGTTLALARAFFVGSLYAEVFPLNDLFFALLLLLACAAENAPSAEASRRALLQGAFVFGAALAHHPLIVCGLPALVVAARTPLKGTLRAGGGAIGLVAAAAVLPFALSYALVVLVSARHPPISAGDVHDAPSLLRLVLRADYGGPFHASAHAPPELALGRRLLEWAGSFARSASVLALAGAAGLVALARRPDRRAEALVWAFAVLVPGPVFAAMNAHFQQTDEPHAAIAERFTTMALVGLAPAVAIAFVAARDALVARWPRARTGLVAALAVLPAIVLAPALRGVDFARDRRGLAYARDLLRPVPDRSLVLVAGDVAGPAALYVCVVERACGDRIVIAPGLLGASWYREEVAREHPDLVLPPNVHLIHELVLAEVDRRPVFTFPSVLARDPAVLESLEATPALLLLRLTRKEPEALADARASALLWGEAMTDDSPDRCAGCRLDASRMVHPSLMADVPAEYAIAMKNHAVVAREAGRKDLAASLDRRAAALTRPGADSS
jgi:hypothetical protein